jgi:protein-ribulosamine 3-kinase
VAGATLPQALSNAVSATLVEAGDAGPLQAVKHAGGGSINHAARIETARGRYFLKWHDAPPPRFFACEADGLTRLAASGVVSVPTVVGHSQVDGAQTAYLIVEWIPAGDRSNASAEALGHQLAELHRVRQDRYGLDYDNYIGRLPQPNTTAVGCSARPSTG